MTRPAATPRTLVLGVSALALCLVLGAVALVGTGGADDALAADGAGDAGPADAAPEPTPTTTTTVPPTTLPVVERSPLAPGVREIATAHAQTVAQVQVRSTPPPGWDLSLSPVVSPSDPTPPRSALDVDRVALPSAEVPIAGRRVDAVGWTFDNPARYQPPQPLRFGVVERQGRWVRVQVPVRPNGSTGWVDLDQVQIDSTTRSVQVSLTERRLRVIDSGGELMSVPISIGRTSTPTPTGDFTVTDVVPSVDPAGPYGPVALALDGYSEALDSFAGSSAGGSPDELAPVLALHGTSQPSSVGRARSNGCPRLFNEDMLRLAALVPAGTPVQIWP